MLSKFLNGEAGKAFDARRAAVAALKTPDDVARRQRELRGKFLEALGGFPEKTPLNARVVGTDDRDGYRVEKVIYESRPEPSRHGDPLPARGQAARSPAC